MRGEFVREFHDLQARRIGQGLDPHRQGLLGETRFHEADFRQQVMVWVETELLGGLLNGGPEAGAHFGHQRFPGWREEDFLLAIVALNRARVGQAHLLERIVDARDGGLANAGGLDGRAHTERAVGLKRGDQGKVRRLDRIGAIVEHAHSFCLQPVGKTLQPTGQAQIANLCENILAHHGIP